MEGEHFVASPDGGVAKAETAAGAVAQVEVEKVDAIVSQEGDKAPETASEEAKPEEAGKEPAEEEKPAEDASKTEHVEVEAIDEKLAPEEHVADEEKPEE